jgi:hypothetical protein
MLSDIPARLGLVCALLASSITLARADDCALKRLASLDTITSSDGWSLIPVKIENTPAYLAVDLANSNSALSETFARSMNLQFVTIEWQNVRGYASAAKFAAHAGLDIGGVQAGSDFALIPRLIGTDPRVAGILGAGFLEHFDVELDLAHHKINLFSKTHCPGKVVYWTAASQVAVMPFKVGEGLTISAKLDGILMDAQVSPASSGLSFNPRIARTEFRDVFTEKRLTEPSVPPANMSPYATSSSYPALHLHSLELSGLVIGNPAPEMMECNEFSPYRSDDLGDHLRDCSDLPELLIGRSELEKLRIYVASDEHVMYATASGAN